VSEGPQDLLIPEIIRRKRDGHALTTAEIKRFVSGITEGEVTDAQIAAFSMASIFQDINYRERTDLTLAMRDSGRVLQWDDLNLNGPVLDKHSTGGVGDTVSFLLAPILAACGGFVPMIAGRGLAHTGGTIDKLESIPGYNTAPDFEHFRRTVRSIGFAIAGQTEDFAPADRRMYATRDVTATVEQYGLITASILSKKLAAGLQTLVMDIKVGNGAFMTDLTVARELAQSLCNVGSQAGMPTHALLTDMNEPLADSAGNALEVLEALRILSGEVKSGRLLEVTEALAIENLMLSGICGDAIAAKKRIGEALSSGAAAEKFEQSIHAMGGPSDLLQHRGRMPVAPIARDVVIPDNAIGKCIRGVDTRALGVAVVALGAGRTHAAQTIDPAVGCMGWLRPGHRCESGDVLATVHARTEADFQAAALRIQRAYRFDDAAPNVANSIVIERLTP